MNKESDAVVSWVLGGNVIEDIISSEVFAATLGQVSQKM